MNNMMEAFAPYTFSCAAEFNFYSLVWMSFQPNFAARKPVVRFFVLPAVEDFLFENAVFIQNGVTAACVLIACQCVHKASCKTAETAVAQTCVRFAFVDSVFRNTKFLEHISSNFVQTHVVKVCLEAAAHQKFYTKVVNLLFTLTISVSHKFFVFSAEHSSYTQSCCLVNVFVSSFVKLL